MKILLVFIFVFTLPEFSVSQIFNFHQTKASSINQLQKGTTAKRKKYDYIIGVSDNYFPNRKKYKLSQPIIFAKEYGSFNQETSYFFSLPDSIIRLIEYQWEGTDKTTNIEFNSLVTQNKKKISEFFKSNGIDYPATETDSEKTIWDKKYVHVEQFFIPKMLRIRVLISWK